MSHLLWYPGYEVLLPDIVRAENCHLFDADGRRYVDLESGVWCTSIGHGHPSVVQAISKQAARISHTGFNYANQIVERAAQEILTLLQFHGGKCVFLCSGSEAVEYGVRVVQTLSAGTLLMTMTDSYFGAYGSARRRPESEWLSFDWSPCVGCRTPHPCDPNCPHWRSIPHDRIGGFVFEPGSSSGLVRFPPKKLIQSVERSIRDNGGLILVNEVTTGVGRTGTWFGFDHYEITPDIVVLGKGIGNGYPVSVTALGAQAIRRLDGEPVPYAQSHQNDPLGAAVVSAVVRVIQEDRLIERGREMAALLATGLAKLRSQSRIFKDLRARGLLIAVELHDDAKATLAQEVQHELLKRGFLLARRPGLSVLRIDPALTIEAGDIRAFLDACADVLDG